MKGIHVYLTVSHRKGVKSTITLDLPKLPLAHLTVGEALIYADGLTPADDPVNVWLRDQILRAVARIRADQGEE